MQKIAISVAILLTGLAIACSRNTPGPQMTATPAVINCAAAEVPSNVPPTPNTIDSTCAKIPTDMNGTGDTQPGPDLYSWLTFVAVNWPVDPSTCTGNTNASILTATPDPVWLSYLSDDDIFVASGSPANWCHGTGPQGARFASADEARAAQRTGRLAKLPPKVRALAEQHPDVRLFLHHSSKGHGLISTTKLTSVPVPLKEILDATGQPVTDQNGRFVRYTINIGPIEYQYIMQNKLWTAAGQQATGALTFTNGAMEFKAAWKVLGANDDLTRYFTQKAIVYNDEDGSPSPGPNPVTVGLAGLHIIQKTPRQPHWLWSTFVQTDVDMAFNNPNCPAAQCPPNVQTAPTPYVELNSDGSPRNKPVQVVGVIPTTAATYNSAFQGLLKGTPWANYRLISTQWQGGSGPPTKPPKLGNPLLETFVSQTNPYSCLDCHNFAQTSPGGSKSDFSFVINAKQ
ncbi:MAG TPA: hypothetical protein VFZ40_06910 [Pyrinomonadaceae bacterium]